MSGLPELPTGAGRRMAERLDAQIAASGRRRARRHRTTAALAAAVLLAGGGGIAAVVVANHFEQGHVAYCYSAADTHSHSTQVGLPAQQLPTSGTQHTVAGSTDPAQTALDNCAAAWRVSLLGPVSGVKPGAVPPLVACLRPDGLPAVFPLLGSDDSPIALCTRLGMGFGVSAP